MHNENFHLIRYAINYAISSTIKMTFPRDDQVKGQVNGRTVLPMPAGLEKVTEVERLVSTVGPQAVDLYLKSAIEGVVIKWAYLVNDVVTHESSAAFENGQQPTPNVELEYWSAKLANLRWKRSEDQKKERKNHQN